MEGYIILHKQTGINIGDYLYLIKNPNIQNIADTAGNIDVVKAKVEGVFLVEDGEVPKYMVSTDILDFEFTAINRYHVFRYEKEVIGYAEALKKSSDQMRNRSKAIMEYVNG